MKQAIFNLTPEGQKDYEDIRTRMNALLAKPDGLTLVLNALVASGSETTLDEIQHWITGVEDIDRRDLVGYCYGRERIVLVEATMVDS